MNPAVAGTAANPNACFNNAPGSAFAYFDATITMTGVGGEHSSTQVSLSTTAINAQFDPETVVAGYNLGLLVLGPNTVPYQAYAEIAATNTLEMQVALPVQTGFFSVIISDPDGVPNTGDESGDPTPLDVPVALPDTLWTPIGGDIEFTQGPFTLTAFIGGFAVDLGPCEVGTVDLATDMPVEPPPPTVPFEVLTDADGDGVMDDWDPCFGDNASGDDDMDLLCNSDDDCPNDKLNDVDNDDHCGDVDNCPNDFNPDQANTDGPANIPGSEDLLGDVCDPCPLDDFNDSDGDGSCDTVDICEGGDDNVDTDSDGIPNFCDECPDTVLNDTDNDGVCGDVDICEGGDDNVDTDSDGIPNFCDIPCPDTVLNDTDNDGVCGDVDICEGGDDNVDTDSDGIPNFCDIPCPDDATNDVDEDGVCGLVDNCDMIPNPDQANTDGDEPPIGDACDICPEDIANDADDDGFCEVDDNCDMIPNPDQLDTDLDGVGDACEPDRDGDGVPDDTDNCLFDPNTDQADSDGDGVGDVCDLATDSDGDGVSDEVDACLGTPPGAPVLANGCSPAQVCPCNSAWKNHGAYVKCNAHVTNKLVEDGVITEEEKDAIMSAAGSSSCGSKNK